MNWYFKALTNYINFSGRATRKEYWYYMLFTSLIGGVIVVLENLYGETIQEEGAPFGVGTWLVVFIGFNIIPHLSVTVRRLHDINKTGWFMLVFHIPIIGMFWFIALMVQDSYRFKNKWGDYIISENQVRSFESSIKSKCQKQSDKKDKDPNSDFIIRY